MRKIFTGLTMLIFTVTATAQKAEFGIKGGINAARFSVSPNDEGGYKTLISGHFGILEHIHISKMFAVQPELLFSGQGTKYKISNNDFKYSLGYINIPVLLQLMTDNGFRFETGPQVGFLVSGKRKLGSASEDVKGVFKSTDFAWVFGIGYITASRFGFDVRYNLGLSDITKDNDASIKNMVLQAGVFYQFHK